MTRRVFCAMATAAGIKRLVLVSDSLPRNKGYDSTFDGLLFCSTHGLVGWCFRKTIDITRKKLNECF